jgi:hypothetical protein
VLTLSGERKAEHEDKREGYVRVERAFGSFRRSLTLPEGVDPEAVQASFDNGVLEVRIPLEPVPSLRARAERGPAVVQRRGSASSSRSISSSTSSSARRRRSHSTSHSTNPPSTTAPAPPRPAMWMIFSALWPTK